MTQNHSFLIVSCFRNAEDFIQASMDYSLQQQYESYRVVFVDDASTDKTVDLLMCAIDRNSDTLCQQVFVERNQTRRGMLWNTHQAILKYAKPGDIIVIVDGDDRLLHRDVLTYINAYYIRNDCWIMYGGAQWTPPGSQVFWSLPYTDEELRHLRTAPNAEHGLLAKKWRVHHVRTFFAALYFELGRRDPNWDCLKDNSGNYYSMAPDAAIMRPLLELAGSRRIQHNRVPLYVYNLHAMNEHVVDGELQWKCVQDIFAKPTFLPVDTLLNDTSSAPTDENREIPQQGYVSVTAESFSIKRALESKESKNLETLPALIQHQSLTSTSSSSFTFRIPKGATLFSCGVARTEAHLGHRDSLSFLVHADEQLVAFAPDVRFGDPPRTLQATVSGAATLRLTTIDFTGPNGSGQWIRPSLTSYAGPAFMSDALHRAEIEIPSILHQTENCIATVATPSHAKFLEAMLTSLRKNGDCENAGLFVISVNDDGLIRDIADRFRATVIPCRPFFEVDPTIKSVLYSIASLVRAKRYLCLDTDMVVHGEITSLFRAIDVLPEQSIVVAREGNGNQFDSLRQAVVEIYRGQYRDLDTMIPPAEEFSSTKLIVNDGIFAGGRQAMLLLDSYIRGQWQLRRWVFERPGITWRNQFAFNLALARFGNGVRVCDRYNIQLEYFQHKSPERFLHEGWSGSPISILHYNGNSRPSHPSYAATQD